MSFYIVPTAPDDYTSVEDVLTFSPGINESCTTIIPIVNDSVLENDETFSVVLITADLDVSLDLASATIAIVDNDSKTSFNSVSGHLNFNITIYPFCSDVTVGLQQLSYIVSEDSQVLIICVTLSGQSEREVFISVGTSDGSAEGK